MTVGLNTFTDTGLVQVDTNNRTMLLLKSGQYTANDANTAADLWYKQQADIAGRMTNRALLLVRSGSPGLNLSIGTNRGQQKLMNFRYPRGNSIPFQYYIFDVMPASNAAKFGLQSFDESGNIIYDAMDYPMKILGVINTGNNTTPTHRVVFTAPHGNIAVGCLGGGFEISSSEYDAYTFAAYHYVSGSTIRMWYNYDQDPSGISIGLGSYGTAYGNHIIVDTSALPLNYLRT